MFEWRKSSVLLQKKPVQARTCAKKGVSMGIGCANLAYLAVTEPIESGSVMT